MVVDSNVGAEINVVLLIFSLYRNIQKISGSRRSLIVPFRARFNRDLFISQATSTATSFHSFFSGNFGIMTSYLNSTYRVCVSTKIGKDQRHICTRERSPINFYVTACDHSFVFSPGGRDFTPVLTTLQEIYRVSLMLSLFSSPILTRLELESLTTLQTDTKSAKFSLSKSPLCFFTSQVFTISPE